MSFVGDILDRLEEQKEREKREGRVISTGDGIARVTGLGGVMSGELVEFTRSKLKGLALNLEFSSVGVVIFGDNRKIEEGDKVVRCNTKLAVKVGFGLSGRIVDALGDPIDGKGDLDSVESGLVEVKAPSVVERMSVRRPLMTGIKAIDSLVPIGRGQRELVIGDRQTGKTAICLDAILSQNRLQDNLETLCKCIYVGVGQKRSSIVKLNSVLDRTGGMSNVTIVVASSSEAASLQYLAPFAGCTMAEFFLNKGMDSLIIYDDLSKQAVAYRQMSLLLRRPPGREAYPGDVFYLHSRLLERAVQLSIDCGGGSITALPVVETQANDVSAYIPTNVISITDGQIFLESGLFNEGVRPAINAGLSVSRVGSAAQTKNLRKVSGSLKLELAQYREMVGFEKLGASFDKETAAILHRGARLTEMLKQKQYNIYKEASIIVSLYLGICGFYDKVAVAEVNTFEGRVLAELTNSVTLGTIYTLLDEYGIFLDQHIAYVVEKFVR